MKNYIRHILCSILLMFPFLTFGKTTCNTDDYRAVIELDKENIFINDVSNIKISSEFNYEVEYKIENKNIININNEGVIEPIASGNTNVFITIKFIENDVKVSECTSNLNINVLSNDSSLKTLNLEEYDLSSVFNKDLYEYELKLPYKYKEVNIVAIANDENATVTGAGRKNLKEGTNDYEIIVKAVDGTTSTYKIAIIREEANNDNTLNNLIVEGYELSPKFNKDKFEYTLNVPKEVEEITVKAIATDSMAKIRGIGKYSLATGENQFFVIVTAENGLEQKYTLIVNKNKGNGKLNELKIEGYNLDKDFSSEVFTYYLTINDDIDKLNIIAKSYDGQVEVIGNENLQKGENNIIIRISGNDISATTYKLIVNKLNQTTEGKNSVLLKALLIIFILSIIIMFLVIGIFLKRNYLNGKIKNCKKNKIYRKRGRK